MDAHSSAADRQGPADADLIVDRMVGEMRRDDRGDIGRGK